MRSMGGGPPLGWVAYFIKDFHGRVDDVQLQELVGEVLHPKVHGARIQAPQEQHGAGINADADQVVQLVSPQGPRCGFPRVPFAAQQGAQADGSARHPRRQNCENRLRTETKACNVEAESMPG